MRKYTSLFLVSTTAFLTAFTSLASADAKIDHRKNSIATVRCHVPTKAKVAALFDRWNKSLLTGDPAKVVANYAPDAVLLPTLSKKVRYTQKEREDYFRGFLKKKPVGHIDSRTIRTGCNEALDTGTYTFTFGDGSKAAARYTFTYGWNGKNWVITSHHSSAMPQ
ncbi:SgcJ/EcaC family oxidoreductase [Brucella sp. 458]|uniref:SgcJ/EcaC family oxidoreductase n=1 Tax=unclassified Brucella TaxID=2632610 RepID=UPI0015DD5DC6|nr:MULTISPECIES: SgcJ/EcaC family oxidoreductase [unclassified Brucella]QTN98705.1 SgcJ/EcaC family oxidoreductase [Brucella sp. 458]CAB4325278.1 calcium/calmodulin dependent protein kinase II [Brucella sp. 191011898]